MILRHRIALATAALAAGCSGVPPQVEKIPPGVVFAYPSDGQLDVPLGTRVVVTFSEPVAPDALGACTGAGSNVMGAFCLVGPNGPVDAMPEVTGDGRIVQLSAPPLDPGTTYALYVRSELDPEAQNLPPGPLVTFTTRSDRPRAAPPALIAVNGNDPSDVGDDAAHPMFDTSTIRLVFSEPLDPRSVVLGPGAVELVDMATGNPVPATLLSDGIHVSLDPVDDLTGGATYQVRLGSQLVDLGGQPLATTWFTLVPKDTRGASGPIPQVLRTRQAGDPGAATSRTGGTPNAIEIDHPLIGQNSSQLAPSALAGELGDPQVLGGPIAFTLRRGQRLRASGLDIALGGTIPVGLSTGDIEIELLSDAGGRIYRNPHQDPSQTPDNDRAPLYVDLQMDVAIYAVDPEGNAVLTQTVLGVQATGTVIATQGVLDIETMTSMDLGLLGVTKAPSNLVLELITDANATVDADTTPPSLVATFPAAPDELPVEEGAELIFSEPIDLDRARAGGIQLQGAGGQPVPARIESHGAAVVVRPITPLAYGASYQVVLGDVADLAGNALASTAPIALATPNLVGTDVPMAVTSVHPGVACSLTGATATSPGRCDGGDGNDELYQPFTLAPDEAISVAFSAPPDPSTLVLGAACGTGSVRVEQIDDAGACVAPVPGTLTHHDRQLGFVPDAPWLPGTHYRLRLVSGNDENCDPGELCGIDGVAASFDPLNGTTNGDGGGPDLVIDFTGAPAAPGATSMFAAASPFTDVNGSGFVEGGEALRDANRAAMKITGTSGAVGSASFTSPDCIPATPETEACIYLDGGMVAAMQPVATSCPLPGGQTAASCVPVLLSPQAMYGTSVSMKASVGITVNTDTGTAVMRVREPAQGPITAYIIDDAGTPSMIVSLDLYMDAPDMSIPLASHDLHSKPLTVVMKGPVTFLPDGRIAIAVANTADVPLTVNISAPLGIKGGVDMVIPAGELKLQLISPLLRGGLP